MCHCLSALKLSYYAITQLFLNDLYYSLSSLGHFQPLFDLTGFICPLQVCPPPSIQVTNVSRKNLIGACIVAASHSQVVVVTKAYKEAPM